jgi:hypothetical protein
VERALANYGGAGQPLGPHQDLTSAWERQKPSPAQPSLMSSHSWEELGPAEPGVRICPPCDHRGDLATQSQLKKG